MFTGGHWSHINQPANAGLNPGQHHSDLTLEILHLATLDTGHTLQQTMQNYPNLLDNGGECLLQKQTQKPGFVLSIVFCVSVGTEPRSETLLARIIYKGW